MTRRRVGQAAATAVLASCLVLLGGCARRQDPPVSRADMRTPLQLSANEREDLRLGMRVYLESVQGIVDALPQNKMVLVASNAKRAGMGMVQDVPASLVMKLPPEFLMFSLDTHQKFEALSRVAAENGTKAATLEQLSSVLANCTACHAMYRLSP